MTLKEKKIRIKALEECLDIASNSEKISSIRNRIKELIDKEVEESKKIDDLISQWTSNGWKAETLIQFI